MALDESTFNNKKSVNLSHRNLKILQANVIEQYAAHCEYLDLSGNRLSTLDDWIYKFPHLKCLVLDDNCLCENHIIQLKQPLYNIQVLMLNKNEFSDLMGTADLLGKIFPNLNYLSLHGNPICPDSLQLQPFGSYTINDYEHYKTILLNALPKLKFLDHSPLSLAATPNATPQHSKLFSHDIWSKFKRIVNRNNQRVEKINLHKATLTYRGTHSEGNRFITNSDL